jgi:DNA (cytosine-5)-methyltransferase 1
MKYLSVCSGIEAASAAWHGLGFEPVGFSEIEPFPSAVLAHRFPHVKNFGDMTKFKEWNIGSTIDILVGGTPCQSFSVAGLRKGLDDPRGNLMLTFGAIANHFKPRFIVWENVPGVLSTNGGRDFGAFLGMLEECGYGFAYRILDAQHFGVPQRRRRVFVVGCLGDWDTPAKILFESESLRWDIAPSRKARKDIAGTLGSRTTGGGGFGTGFELSGGVIAQPQKRAVACGYDGDVLGDRIGTMRTGEGRATDTSHYVFAQTQYGEKAGALTARHDSSPCADRGQNIVVMAQNASGEIRLGDKVGTLSTNSNASGRNTPIISYGIPGSWIGRKPENGSNSVDPTHNIAPCLTRTDVHGVQRGSIVRRLTPLECERLQGFPSVINRSKFKVWYDNQKNCVNVEITCHKSQNSALSAEESVKQEFAKYVEENFKNGQERKNRLAVVRVPTNCGQTVVASLNQEKYLLNVNGVGKKNTFHQFMQQESFAQAVALISSIVEKEMQDGKVELHLSTMHSTLQQNGRWLAAIFGQGIEEYASAVENSQQEVIKYITSNYGQNFQNLNSKEQTWLYFALDVISSCIPERISKDDFYEFWLEVESGWTRIPWRGKPEADCPDGPRYKACGNSMAVPVMRWIGERIKMFAETEKPV